MVGAVERRIPAPPLLAQHSALRSREARHQHLCDPESGQDWTSGWLIYAENDRNQTFTGGDAEIYRRPAMTDDITVDNSGRRGYRGFLAGSERYVSFNGSGYPRTKGGGFQASRLVFTNGDPSESCTVVLAPSGRARIRKVGETARLADND